MRDGATPLPPNALNLTLRDMEFGTPTEQSTGPVIASHQYIIANFD